MRLASRALASRALASLALALAAAAACTKPVPVTEPTPGSPGAPRSVLQENLIAEDEIRTTSATTVFMLIERVRPQYLRPMPGLPAGLSGTLPLVFVDGRRRGPVGTLRTMQPADVVSIRRLSPSQAQARYGPDAASGIIEVSTRHPR